MPKGILMRVIATDEHGNQSVGYLSWGDESAAPIEFGSGNVALFTYAFVAGRRLKFVGEKVGHIDNLGVCVEIVVHGSQAISLLDAATRSAATIVNQSADSEYKICQSNWDERIVEAVDPHAVMATVCREAESAGSSFAKCGGNKYLLKRTSCETSQWHMGPVEYDSNYHEAWVESYREGFAAASPRVDRE